MKKEEGYEPDHWKSDLEFWCKECDERIRFYDLIGTRFCPNCGAEYRIKIKIVKVVKEVKEVKEDG